MHLETCFIARSKEQQEWSSKINTAISFVLCYLYHSSTFDIIKPYDILSRIQRHFENGCAIKFE